VTLTAADVAEIMRLVEQSSFDELTLELDGVKLSLRRGAAVASDAHSGSASNAMNSAGVSGVAGAAGSAGAMNVTRDSLSAARASADRGTANGAAATRANPAPSAPSDPNVHDVPSPLLGTFYRSPKPGAPPYVEVGATVEEDTVVAIIEVMKLMNTVRAGVRGTVTEILPADGSLVEYEQTLLRVRKTG
jgi:acetyl-CoA carboxylase biotin carboxyl carrier protein